MRNTAISEGQKARILFLASYGWNNIEIAVFIEREYGVSVHPATISRIRTEEERRKPLVVVMGISVPFHPLYGCVRPPQKEQRRS